MTHANGDTAIVVQVEAFAALRDAAGVAVVWARDTLGELAARAGVGWPRLDAALGEGIVSSSQRRRHENHGDVRPPLAASP